MSDLTAARLVEAMALQIGLHTGAKASDVQAAAKAALAALREAAGLDAEGLRVSAKCLNKAHGNRLDLDRYDNSARLLRAIAEAGDA